jgi:ferric-dicitrate binding protein FerR (iron transport regulator)
MEDFSNIGSKELLISKYLSGNSSAEESEELLHWVGLSEENRLYFSQFQLIWVQSEEEKHTNDNHWEQLLNRIEDRENTTIRWNNLAEERKERSFRVMKYAAVFTGFLVLSAIFFYLMKVRPSAVTVAENVIEVPYGSKMSLTLPDHSKLWINSGSKVVYDHRFGVDHRRIRIEGEVFFEVAKNPKLPFIVQAGNVSIRALGTAFNVKAYPEEKLVETTLVHGSVEVNKAGEKKSVLLKPSEKIVIKNVNKSKENINLASSEFVKGNKQTIDSASSGEVVVNQDVNVEKETAWKEGKLIFERESLENLATKLMRKYDVSFSFQDEELKSYKFTGTFNDLSLEQIMEALSFSAPVDYDIFEKQVLLKPKNRNR